MLITSVLHFQSTDRYIYLSPKPETQAERFQSSRVLGLELRKGCMASGLVIVNV